MPSLIDLRRRIRSVQNTKKITRAMEMVASSKLTRLQDMLTQSSFFVHELRSFLATVLMAPSLPDSVLLQKRKNVENVLVFLITSDTGLCGTFNSDLLNKTTRFIANMDSRNRLRFVGIGKKGIQFLKRSGLSVETEMAVPRPIQVANTIREVADMAIRAFTEHRADEIYFIYTFLESKAAMKPKAELFLPFMNGTHLRQSVPSEKNEPPRYILEPDAQSLLEKLLPDVIEAEVGQFIKHALIAEQLSRMMAMKQATDSAADMIDSLTLIRNKARQAAITTELTEVVSGARALQKD